MNSTILWKSAMVLTYAVALTDEAGVEGITERLGVALAIDYDRSSSSIAMRALATLPGSSFGFLPGPGFPVPMCLFLWLRGKSIRLGLHGLPSGILLVAL